MALFSGTNMKIFLEFLEILLKKSFHLSMKYLYPTSAGLMTQMFFLIFDILKHPELGALYMKVLNNKGVLYTGGS